MNNTTRHFLLLLLCMAPSLQAAEHKRPNILLIISDDQGWTDFGFMGHPVVRTPQLDRLAAQGVVFPNGYTTAPVCRPSLASIITGRFGFETKICGNNPPKGTPRQATHGFLQQVATVPRLLGKAGYRSLQTGKFWEGSYANAGFTDGMTDEGDRHGSRQSLAIGRDGLKPIEEFVEAAGEHPWLIWYAPMMPHAPHTPPQRILDRYLAPDRPPALSKYWAMCEWFDETCGQLLDYLARRKVLDDTVVIFIVDNGWIQETGPVRKNVGWFTNKSKLSPYDGGIRTPVIVRWPGHVRPQRRMELVSAIDLAPTILRAAGLEPDPGMKGTDLVDVAAGRIDLANRPVFAEVYSHDEVRLGDPASSLTHRVVRQGDWKLILPRSAPPELYEVARDATEEHNLAAAEPGRVTRLTALLDHWWAVTASTRTGTPATRPNRSTGK